MRQHVDIMAQPAGMERPTNEAREQAVSGSGCQQRDDAKAFKAFTGRGRERLDETVKLQARLDRVRDSMAELVAASKQVPGRSFYLALHRRAVNGQTSLRWRTTAGNRHLGWHEMPALFAVQLPAIRAWYLDVQRRIEALNQEEQLVRGSLRRAARLSGFGVDTRSVDDVSREDVAGDERGIAGMS